MKKTLLGIGFSVMVCMLAVCSNSAFAQGGFAVVTGEAVTKAVPGDFYLEGNRIPVEKRNAALLKNEKGARVVVGLIDTAGYSSQIKQKYNGMLITETKISVCGTSLDVGSYGFGLEQVMQDLVINKDFMHAYLDRLMKWIDEAGSRLVGLGVDVIWIGDDFGMQDGMVISPQLFREFFKPRYAYLFSKWKTLNPNVKIAFHSDGNIFPIIPDLIEVGLDILNPVQPKSMDPAKVKKMYGDKLTFWGTVDIQEVMPFGTVEDVANEVKLRIQTVGPGGGFIISPAHNIQAQVPLANILAYYEAAKKFGRYPLSGN